MSARADKPALTPLALAHRCAGVFAASPGEWDSWRLTNSNCSYCDFDSVCVRDRGDQATAKSEAPELAVRVSLTPARDAEPS